MNEDLKWLAENEHEWKDGAIAVAYRNGGVLWFYDHAPLPAHPYYWGKPQWQAARDELSGKPGWELARTEYDWRAQDEDGQWCFYKSKPKADSGQFTDNQFSGDGRNHGRVLGDWRNTLERRPEAGDCGLHGPIPSSLKVWVKCDPTDTFGPATVGTLRQFALSQIRAAADCTITDDDVRAVFINLITELDDEALAGVAGRVVK